MKRTMMLLGIVAVVGLVAGTVLSQEAAPAPLKGTVVKVDAPKVVVKVGDKEVTVTTDDKTAVVVDGKEAKLADLKAGMPVAVTPAEGTAAKIAATTVVKGAISKVDGAKVMVKVGEDKREVVVTTNDKTKVTLDGKEAKVADLKAGMTVAATIDPVEGTAITVEAKAPEAK